MPSTSLFWSAATSNAKRCRIIPDEDLRLALVVLALGYNKNEQVNREIFHRQTQEIDSLKEKIKELEAVSK